MINLMTETKGFVKTSIIGGFGLDMVDVKTLKQMFEDCIKKEKKIQKRCIVRYEIDVRTLNSFQCYDKCHHQMHTNNYKKHGFYEYKREKVKINSINCERVVLRNRDESKNFRQFDGLMSGYVKADCELVYHEVIY